MATRMASSYANIFMGVLEDTFLKSQEVKPDIWWCYIDDIFYIWRHGEGKLIQFIDSLKQFHPTIKVTVNVSHTDINFLDVSVALKDGLIVTDLYTKPTDKHVYLIDATLHIVSSVVVVSLSIFLRLMKEKQESMLLRLSSSY